MRKGPVLLLLFAISLPGLAHPASEQERNKGVARSFFEEVLGQGRLDKYGESHAKDFVAHASDHDATLEEDMAAAREERKALPDMGVRVNQMVAERDLVAVYWTSTGTNTQAGMGFPATGKKIKVEGMTLFRFKGGKILEEWSVWDMLSVMRQAGLLPPKQ
ncbi:MAG TPA: ester cyclase [Terriglobales bacterium]|nr:ester cyclase [Terriglobales bacterium]